MKFRKCREISEKNHSKHLIMSSWPAAYDEYGRLAPNTQRTYFSVAGSTSSSRNSSPKPGVFYCNNGEIIYD